MSITTALVLHGRVPSWRGRSLTETSSDTSLLNASRRSLAQFAASSLRRHVLQPNAGMLEVVVHSWSPECADVWDDILQPTRQLHEPVIHGLSALRSQHLSMTRALSLLSSSTRLVLVARLDLLLFTNVELQPLLGALSPNDEALWLPHSCQRSLLPGRMGEMAAVREACGCLRGNERSHAAQPIARSPDASATDETITGTRPWPRAGQSRR